MMSDFDIKDNRIFWDSVGFDWEDDSVWKESGKPVKESDIITFPLDCGCGEGSNCFNVWWEKAIKKN